MKILVTGAKGFLGKNLIAELKNTGYSEIFEFTRDTNFTQLEHYTRECNFVFHLAGVNRPQDDNEFMEGNFGLTSQVLTLLNQHQNKAPILITSSIQAEQDHPYGRSKKAAEELVAAYQRDTGVEVYMYRLPNVFGKWSKPHYNSVVATFCHNIARDLDIQVNNPNAELNLCYIDDVVEEFKLALEGKPTVIEGRCTVAGSHPIKIGELADLIRSFKDSRSDLYIPDMENALIKALYSTYLSFLPEDQFSYDLTMHRDDRGSFTEFLRSRERGQVSINVSKPHITKGDHWHHTKNEKFLVVSGKGVIRFRGMDSDKMIEYEVSGDKLQSVDIPPGYAHSIVNTGDSDLVTVMWANECFDAEKPDTYFLEV
ncbi:capsular polysaccharide biosynthesis protein CapF [Sporosarcina sp. P1]|uniref:capsular polysaccharide biosynthesis protein CapF n=1 Tax=Sporosarcina sp. P1 TaxID=2048257 RepID=UPI000C173598|nr:capsular polysaccharide biosynthesis protein CapF [Sporosarcina sp. P1]PIC83141.1 capsular biosynthesis protein [Sporosarcina sp. P1]